MLAFNSVFQDALGNGKALATIKVYLSGSEPRTLATIYRLDGSAVNQTTNPIKTNVRGQYGFRCADATIDIEGLAVSGETFQLTGVEHYEVIPKLQQIDGAVAVTKTAADSAGLKAIFASYNLATPTAIAGIGALANGDWFEIAADERLVGSPRTRAQKIAGSFGPAINMDQLRVDLKSGGAGKGADLVYLDVLGTGEFPAILSSYLRQFQASPTDAGAKGNGSEDDTDATQLVLSQLGSGQKILFPKKDGQSISTYLVRGDLVYPNGITIEGQNLKSVVKLGDNSNPTHGVFVSEMKFIDATTSAFQSKKQHIEFRNLLLDCNGDQGATSTNGYTVQNPNANKTGHGLVIVADRARLENIYVLHAPWCSIKQTHTGLNDTAQSSGNMVYASYRRIMLIRFGMAFRPAEFRNNIDLEKATALYIGENGNGRITDGRLDEVFILSGPKGLQLGTAAGWFGNAVRMAAVDLGALLWQPTRTIFSDFAIDDFGTGWDGARRGFIGLQMGRNLSGGGHWRVTGNIQCNQVASRDSATPSEYSYVGVRVVNPNNDAPDCAGFADVDMMLGHRDDGASSICWEQETSNNRSFIVELRGKMRRYKRLSALAVDTKFAIDRNPPLTTGVHRKEAAGKKIGIVAGAATPFAQIDVTGTQSAHVLLHISADRNTGYCGAGQLWQVYFGKDDSTAHVHVGVSPVGALLGASQSSTLRQVTAITITATVSSSGTEGSYNNRITLSANPTFAGSTTTDTTIDLSWEFQGLGDREIDSVIAL